jgi:hypothetical protein
MLTRAQAMKIVRDCLSKMRIRGRRVRSGQRLRNLGIDGRLKILKMKSLIVINVRRYGYKLASGSLTFNSDSTVAKICNLVVAEAKPLKTRDGVSNVRSEVEFQRLQPIGVKSIRSQWKKKAKGPKRRLRARSRRGGGSKKKGKVHAGSNGGPNGSANGGKLNSLILPPATRIVESTPQMEIRKELVPKKAYRMGVFVDQRPEAPGADVQPLRIEVPRDLQDFPVDVWFDCSSHFSVMDVDKPSNVIVNTETGVSSELNFTLNVVKAADEKPMYVSAYFRYNGRPCGKITRYLELGDSLHWKFYAPRETEGEVILPNADVPPSFTVEAQARAAEIRVEVLRTEANDGQHFTMICHTPQGDWEGAWNLPRATRDLVNVYMKKFIGNKGDARIASLKGAGLAFWDAVPESARNLLWKAIENGASSMSVISEEPYVPWELMIPYKKVQNARPPLGVELQLGRWVTGNYASPPQHIPLKSGYVVSPKTSGLTSARQEVAFLTQSLKADFAPVDEVLPATFSGVDKGLGGNPRDVIHFVCHGQSAALQTLELDKPDTLDCSQVRTMVGFQAAFKDGPLAFLNACEVGGQVLALDGVGGFANSFIELGAGAVVAPLWPVQDAVALEVTQTFYPLAIKGVPFGEIMKQIRASAYSQGIDSYAAYCFYGDPIATAG